METIFFKRQLIFSLLFGMIILAGCSTTQFLTPLSATKLEQKPSEYLDLAAKTPSSALALEYRLQAADINIREGKSEAAQQILRETRVNQPIDPALYQSILTARLALLNNDLPKARAILQSIIQTLSQQTAGERNAYSPLLTTQQHIAVLLPSKGPHAAAAKVIRDGFLAAYYKGIKDKISEPSLKFYDTGTGQGIQAAYKKAIDENATFIVGPLTKFEVQAMINLRLNIPVLALNTIAEGIPLPAKLYQFGLMPEDEVVAVADHAMHQGHKAALVLAPQNEWGKRLSNAFQTYWQAQGGQIIDVRLYKSGEDIEGKIRALLKVKAKERRQDADMIFLAASSESARKIKPLLNFYFAENLPVFSTSAVYSGTLLPSKDQDLEGIRFCDMPWILQHSAHAQETHNTLQNVWQSSVTYSPRFFALGMDAYQLATVIGNSQTLPYQGISGFTGNLHVNQYHRVQRKLTCAKFAQGIPVPD